MNPSAASDGLGLAGGAAADAGKHIWPLQAILQAVEPLLPGFTVEVLPTIDSTNSELLRRARAGARDPVLLVAEQQTAGRGRLGRSWQSDAALAHVDAGWKPGVNRAGGALTFSLALPLALQDWSGLSLAVGVSVAQGLHPELQLKWPNDIWLRDRKLAGILIETASFADRRYAVIGVGVNIGPRDGAGLATPPACLQELLPELDAPAVLQRLVLPLVQALLLFGTHGFAPFQARFKARDALRGRAVVLSDGSTGIAAGVDSTGALLVDSSAGIKVITSAEVSVRPAVAMVGPGDYVQRP